MSRKLGHEKLNRQEKAWREPTGCVGGDESPGLWQFYVTHDHQVRMVLNRTVARRIYKSELMDAFKAEVRRMRFVVSGYKFSFTDSAKSFSTANGLKTEGVQRMFQRVRREAEERLRIVITRMSRKPLEVGHEWDEKEKRHVEVYTLRYDDLPKFLTIDGNVPR
jgi:hypothetical protein